MTDNHSGQNIPVAAGAAYPSPASPEHEFEWPVPGPQFNHIPPNGNWMTNANAQYYQPNNQQTFFTTPNYDRPQMPWPRHDSFYPTENNTQCDTTAQGFHVPQNKDTGLPSDITMVPRNDSDAFLARSSGAPGGRVRPLKRRDKYHPTLTISKSYHDVPRHAALLDLP